MCFGMSSCDFSTHIIWTALNSKLTRIKLLAGKLWQTVQELLPIPPKCYAIRLWYWDAYPGPLQYQSLLCWMSWAADSDADGLDWAWNSWEQRISSSRGLNDAEHRSTCFWSTHWSGSSAHILASKACPFWTICSCVQGRTPPDAT